MKKKLQEVMREFYENGLPETIHLREVAYTAKLRAATVIKGMRRTGKTFVAYAEMRRLINDGIPLGRIVHVNFEDDRISRLTADDLHLINEIHAELYPEYSDQACWYFLDEIQVVEGWESYARRLVDSPKVYLCLSGSSSKLLGEEIATQMRGRSIPIEVFPYSFREFVTCNGIMKSIPSDGFTPRETGILRRAMEDYIAKGGFPDVQDLPPPARISVLQGYIDAVLYRDVIERHDIASVQALRYTLDYLFHNYARKISARAISGVLKNLSVPANKESISNYLGFFKDAYLTYPVSIRSDSLAVKRVNPDKYYLIDTGLVNAVCAKDDAERGWLLENLVFLCLRRQLKKIEYYVTHNGREVDFHVLDVVSKKRSLVQVAWEMKASDTTNRELAAMRTAREETGITDCAIVTRDDEGETEDGIKIVPVWKWALQ